MTDAERSAVRMQVLTLAATHMRAVPGQSSLAYLDQVVVWVLTGDLPAAVVSSAAR